RHVHRVIDRIAGGRGKAGDGHAVLQHVAATARLIVAAGEADAGERRIRADRHVPGTGLRVRERAAFVVAVQVRTAVERSRRGARRRAAAHVQVTVTGPAGHREHEIARAGRYVHRERDRVAARRGQAGGRHAVVEFVVAAAARFVVAAGQADTGERGIRADRHVPGAGQRVREVAVLGVAANVRPA